MSKQKLRTEFLEQFVKTLVIQIKPRSIGLEQEIEEKIFPTIRIKPSTSKAKQKTKFPILKPLILPRIHRQRTSIPITTVPRPITPITMSQPHAITTPLKVQPQPTQQGIPSIDLGKITSILSDPAVIGVECPGPGKVVLVNRSGRNQSTNIILTKSEINGILEQISNQTKIPLMPGIFKAAFDNFIMTAVISDYVGSRFIIQKKMPTAQAPTQTR